MNRTGGTRRRAWLVTGLCAGFLPLVFSACSRDPAEARLRQRIADMEDAIRGRKPAAFMTGVSPDFIGSGGLDHDGVRQLLRLQMLRNAHIGIRLESVEVQLVGREADVTFQVMLSGGDGTWLSGPGQEWRVHSGWRDGDDDWQVLQASWKAAP